MSVIPSGGGIVCLLVVLKSLECIKEMNPRYVIVARMNYDYEGSRSFALGYGKAISQPLPDVETLHGIMATRGRHILSTGLKQSY